MVADLVKGNFLAGNEQTRMFSWKKGGHARFSCAKTWLQFHGSSVPKADLGGILLWRWFAERLRTRSQMLAVGLDCFTVGLLHITYHLYRFQLDYG